MLVTGYDTERFNPICAKKLTGKINKMIKDKRNM